MPLWTCTRLELLKRIPMVLVPVPAVFRRRPALATRAEPEFTAKEAPSAARSNVPLGELLNTPPLQLICPAVQVPEALFTMVPPFKVLPPPLKLRPTLATRINGAPELPITPPVH